MTQLGLKSGGLDLSRSLPPHGVALIRISASPTGTLGVEEFYGVFFHGDYVGDRFQEYHKAQLRFIELCDYEQHAIESACQERARA